MARLRYLGAALRPAARPGRPAACEMLAATRADAARRQRLRRDTATVAARVAAARERMARRLAGTPWRVNAEVPGHVLRRRWPLPWDVVAAAEQELDRGGLTARGRRPGAAGRLDPGRPGRPGPARRRRRAGRPAVPRRRGGGPRERRRSRTSAARGALTRLAEPGDAGAGSLVDGAGGRGGARGRSGTGTLPSKRLAALPGPAAGGLDVDADLAMAAAGRRAGAWCPATPEWPAALDDLGPAAAGGAVGARRRRPRAADAAARSRSSGARACTAYGEHVAAEHRCRSGRPRLDGGVGRGVRHRRRGAPRRAGRRAARPWRCSRAASTSPIPARHDRLLARVAGRRRGGQRAAAGCRPTQAAVPQPQPRHRRAGPGHRRGRGGAAQRRRATPPVMPSSCPAQLMAVPGPGDLGDVGRLPRADAHQGRAPGHRRRRRPRHRR